MPEGEPEKQTHFAFVAILSQMNAELAFAWKWRSSFLNWLNISYVCHDFAVSGMLLVSHFFLNASHRLAHLLCDICDSFVFAKTLQFMVLATFALTRHAFSPSALIWTWEEELQDFRIFLLKILNLIFATVSIQSTL